MGVDIARHIAEVGGDIALDQGAEELTALVIDFLHHPDAPRDGDLVADRWGLDDGAQLLGAGTDRVFHVLLEHGVELVVVHDPLARQAQDQSAVFRATHVVDFQQMPQQQTVILLRDPMKAA